MDREKLFQCLFNILSLPPLTVGVLAPAPAAPEGVHSESVLGAVPHTIRGSLQVIIGFVAVDFFNNSEAFRLLVITLCQASSHAAGT